jgi:hypothetical protein
VAEREKWRPVPERFLPPVIPDDTENGAPTLASDKAYEVSDQGRVRSVPRQVAGRGESIRTLQGKILSPRVRPDGTRAVNLWRGNRYRQWPVKRIVLEVWSEREQPPGYEPKNVDDNPANNRVSNLRWEPVGGMALLRRSMLGR